MATYERQPKKIAEWIAAGNEIPEFVAGHIHDFLARRGVAVQGVSAGADGSLVVVVADDETYQKLDAALGAITPADIDPERAKRAAALAVLRSAMQEIRAKPPLLRAPAERALLALAALQGLDDGEIEAAGK